MSGLPPERPETSGVPATRRAIRDAERVLHTGEHPSPEPDHPHAEDGFPGEPPTQDVHPEELHAAFDDGHPPIRRASPKVRRRRRTVVLVLVTAFVVAVAFFAFQAIKPVFSGADSKDYPGPGHGSVAFTIDAGSTGRTVATAMVQQGIVRSESAFLDALNAANGNGSIQPGTFDLKLEMKASDAVAVILAADGNKVHYAAIDQNLRQNEVLALLAKSTGIPLADFEVLAKKPAEFGLPAKATSLEGYLAPGEYRFSVDLDAKAILAKLVATTKASLAAAGVSGDADQFRVLTIASILEFEGNESNYAEISGAIQNRLNHPNAETGGRLESDATVAYGLGIKTYEITDAQKKDASNPYNTFARKGLPIGPIGSPAAKAIDAAAHPTANPYYFWVTVNLDTGKTLYATTYAQHLKNVAKYTAWCGANPGKCK